MFGASGGAQRRFSFTSSLHSFPHETELWTKLPLNPWSRLHCSHGSMIFTLCCQSISLNVIISYLPVHHPISDVSPTTLTQKQSHK